MPSQHRSTSLRVLRENDVAVQLPLVPHCHQVGVIHAPQGEIGPEIKQRAAEAWVPGQTKESVPQPSFVRVFEDGPAQITGSV